MWVLDTAHNEQQEKVAVDGSVHRLLGEGREEPRFHRFVTGLEEEAMDTVAEPEQEEEGDVHLSTGHKDQERS